MNQTKNYSKHIADFIDDVADEQWDEFHKQSYLMNITPNERYYTSTFDSLELEPLSRAGQKSRKIEQTIDFLQSTVIE